MVSQLRGPRTHTDAACLGMGAGRRHGLDALWKKEPSRQTGQKRYMSPCWGSAPLATAIPNAEERRKAQRGAHRGSSQAKYPAGPGVAHGKGRLA